MTSKDGVFSDWPHLARRALVVASTGCALLAPCLKGSAPAFFACASLAAGLLQLFFLDGDLSLLAFLPAVWIALREDLGGGGPRLLVVAALALQARLWLLGFAAVRKRERLDLADRIEAGRPETAVVFVDNDIESEVPLGALREGHLFRIGPGQVLPADGLVTYGSGYIDENLVPGEPEELRLKGMGSSVTAGSRNRNATLLVRASSVGEATFSCRLVSALRRPTAARKALLPDLATAAAALLLAALGGASAAFAALLASSGAAAYAALAASDFSLARVGAARRWLWNRQGLARLARSGLLVTPAPFVLTEGRPKLTAIETTGHLSADAALGLLGPLARRLETPAAFALLLELRARNIPLQLADFFELREEGGLAFLAGEEIRWRGHQAGEDSAPLGPLEPFVREHEGAGEEIVLLERQGTVQAALAFRDETVKGAPEAAAELRAEGFPVLLVSPLPRRCTTRLVSELGVEHAHGEAGKRETEALVSRLAGEKLAPAWVQAQGFRPPRAAAVIGRALAAESADLLLPDPFLPEIAGALSFARRARRRLRFSLGFLYSVQAGLLLAALAAQPAVAGLLHLGSGWPVSLPAFAVAGALPGFLAFFAAHAR